MQEEVKQAVERAVKTLRESAPLLAAVKELINRGAVAHLLKARHCDALENSTGAKERIATYTAIMTDLAVIINTRKLEDIAGELAGFVEPQTEWVFTFGGVHVDRRGKALQFCFVSLPYPEKNAADARAAMMAARGNKWAMQYKSRAEAGVAQWELKERTLADVTLPAELVKENTKV